MYYIFQYIQITNSHFKDICFCCIIQNISENDHVICCSNNLLNSLLILILPENPNFSSSEKSFSIL